MLPENEGAHIRIMAQPLADSKTGVAVGYVGGGESSSTFEETARLGLLSREVPSQHSHQESPSDQQHHVQQQQVCIVELCMCTSTALSESVVLVSCHIAPDGLIRNRHFQTAWRVVFIACVV